MYVLLLDIELLSCKSSSLLILLASNFASASIQYKPRVCNRVAHVLVNLGLSCSVDENPLVIVDDLPVCIMNLVTEDISVHS
jgi:hypothetical protein